MIKTKILTKEKLITLVKLTIITGLSVLAPLFKNQFITGPIVNALLFIATIILGPSMAVLIGFLPSPVSLAIGFLPFVLAPMLPFIILGNTLLVLTFYFLSKKNYWLGVIASSFLKFLFLFVSSQILVNFFLNNPLAVRVSYLMSWPQLVTALTGGLIAYIFLKFIKRI